MLFIYYLSICLDDIKKYKQKYNNLLKKNKKFNNVN